MKIVIAIDSFKGSLNSIEAGEAAKRGILKVFPDSEIIVRPLADGGEGTTSVLVESLNGDFIDVNFFDPLGREITGRYGIINGDTAVIEMAEASGLSLLDPTELDPFKANTFGTGQMIDDALNRGIKNFIIGIGGSATNDGGIGMLQALGVRFLDKDSKELEPELESLMKVETLDVSQLNEKLKGTNFLIASDVTNPLTGDNGATAVFGPQKGIKEEQVEIIDKAMEHYAKVVSTELGVDHLNTPGAGAAGGLGFAFLSFFPNSNLESGVNLILDYLNLKDDLVDSDYLITGEGMLNSQSLMGKVPVGVAKLSKEVSNATTIAIAGGVADDADVCNENGIDAFFPVVRGVSTLEEAMDKTTATKNIEKTIEQVFKLIKNVV